MRLIAIATVPPGKAGVRAVEAGMLACILRPGLSLALSLEKCCIAATRGRGLAIGAEHGSSSGGVGGGIR